MDKIPRDPAWCSRCIRGEAPCDDHTNGHYVGPDVYEPSAWVKDVVGKRYRCFDGVHVCFGYDPREGFWMRSVETGKEKNVSERAIGRSCHEVTMTWGGYKLLRAYADLGRVPAAEDVLGVLLDLATKTLADLGCIDDGSITDIGRAALVEHGSRFS